MKSAEHYYNLSKNNTCEYFKNLEDSIEVESLKGKFILEISKEYNRWFKQAHKEILEDKGFIVEIIELSIPRKPIYICISWGNSIKLTNKN